VLVLAKIKGFAKGESKLRVAPGVWGLILAPEYYYKKHSGASLRQSIRARIAFGVSASLAAKLP
jgi:hypothetical protein